MKAKPRKGNEVRRASDERGKIRKAKKGKDGVTRRKLGGKCKGHTATWAGS